MKRAGGGAAARDMRMGLRERSAERRRRVEVNRASGFEEAERWDLDFWQRRTPEERLSALVAIRRDVEKVQKARAARASEDAPRPDEG